MARRPQADIMLSRRLRLADGTTLCGGTLRGGWGLLLEEGATARIEGVAILDSQADGIDERKGGVVTVQGGRIAGSGDSAVFVHGAG